MSEFAWRAVEPSGRTARGRIEAASAEQAMLRLKAQGLVPLAVEPAGGGAARTASPASPSVPVAPSGGARWRRRDAPVNRRDVLDLTHELAVMLRAGLPLAYALRVLIDMSAKPSVRALLQRVLDDVKDGAPLSRALDRHGALFGPFYISMVRAGEASGQLASTLERLSEHIARMAKLRENVVAAATYPAILLVVALLSLAGMIGFVVPQFEQLFADMGDAVPLATRAVLALSHHARDWGVVWAVVLVLGGWLAWRWARTPTGQLRVQAALLRVPLIGPILHRFQLAVFARTLGTLVGNGVPLLAALDIGVDTVSNQPLRRALQGMLAPVKSGARLAQVMADTRQFEPLAVNLVRVGEETGRLGPMLIELANLTDQRVETSLKRLLTLLEPLLIVVLGALIAGIIVSILLGILSVNEIAV
jgi:general secretion pathway protein F